MKQNLSKNQHIRIKKIIEISFVLHTNKTLNVVKLKSIFSKISAVIILKQINS